MIRFSVLFLVLFSAIAYSSQVYKWVDENGQTQFSQFPPANQQTQQAKQVNIKVQPAADSGASQRLQEMRQKLLEDSVDRNTQSEQEKQDAKEAERMAENCKRAKQRLRDLENTGRIYKIKEDGEYHWYSEKEREDSIQKAREQITKYCQ